MVFLTDLGHREVETIPNDVISAFLKALPDPLEYMVDQIAGHISYQYTLSRRGMESLRREYQSDVSQRNLRIGEYVFNLKDHRTAAQAFLHIVRDWERTNHVARLEEMADSLATCLKEQYPKLTDYSQDKGWKDYVASICAQQEERYLDTRNSQGSRNIYLTDAGRNEVNKIPSELKETFEQAIVASRELEQGVEEVESEIVWGYSNSEGISM
jgi:hypothetical protein